MIGEIVYPTVILISTGLASIIDMKRHEIPHWITYPLVFFGLGRSGYFFDMFAVFLAGIIFFTGLYLHEIGVGGADTVLGVGIALVDPLNAPHILGIAMGLLIVYRKVLDPKRKLVPMGPFFFLGAAAAYLWVSLF